MRILYLVIIVLLSGYLCFAQESNIHVNSLVGSSVNMGLRGLQYGVGSGFDIHKNKLDISINANFFKIRKNAGGKGYEINGKELIRYYFYNNVCIQGGIEEGRYKVTQYNKSFASVIGGVCKKYKGNIFSLNYLHKFWETQHLANGKKSGSSSQMKTIELSAQLFLKHHIYIDAKLDGSRFRSQNKYLTGLSSQLGVGFWFK